MSKLTHKCEYKCFVTDEVVHNYKRVKGVEVSSKGLIDEEVQTYDLLDNHFSLTCLIADLFQIADRNSAAGKKKSRFAGYSSRPTLPKRRIQH